MSDTSKSSLRTYLLYILTIVILIALAGASGFYYFEEVANPARSEEHPRTLWDAFWWAMVTLTTIGYGDIYPVTVGGRLIAMLLMFTGIGILGAFTAAIAAYFVRSDQLQMLRIRRLRDHVIICGLGDKGLLLAKAFRERNMPVLVIEQNENNDLIEPCREQGAIVLLGNATEQEMLKMARLQTARYLIAVCGSDGANAEITAHARELIRDRAGHALTCSAHIVDPELWHLLRRWELSSPGRFRLQFFNVFDIGARAMLDAHPPFHRPSIEQGHLPHLLVIGAGKLGQNVVVHAARVWREEHLNKSGKLRITIVDADTTHLKESLHLRHPALEHTCEVETFSIDPRSPEFHHAAFLFDAQKHLTVTAIYICLDDDGMGLSAALALLHRIRRHHVPIIVRMTQDAGLAALLHTVHDDGRGFQNLHAFGFLERTCQPDLVLGGTNEVLARAIHERYLQDQKMAGQTAHTNPALVPWEKLPEDLKESNRSQAAHIGLKLQSIGCDIAPLTEWGAGSFTFTPEEIEQMARMEHERWMEDRLAQGWTLGPRDPQKKTNPNLVPWEQLSEESRELNRQVIRELPVSLVEAGFQIYRLKTA